MKRSTSLSTIHSIFLVFCITSILIAEVPAVDEEEDEEEGAIVIPVRPEFPPGTDPSLLLEYGNPADQPKESLTDAAGNPVAIERKPASAPSLAKIEPKKAVSLVSDTANALPVQTEPQMAAVVSPQKEEALVQPIAQANPDPIIDTPNPPEKAKGKKADAVTQPIVALPASGSSNPDPTPPIPALTSEPVSDLVSPKPEIPTSVPAKTVFFPGPYSPAFLAKLEEQQKMGSLDPSKRLPIHLDKPAMDLLPQISATAPKPVTPLDGSMITIAVPEVSIILHGRQFVPASVRLKSGYKTKLFITSTGKKPSAIVIDRLSVQRWLAQHDAIFSGVNAQEKPQVEGESINREINSTRVTEIILDPVPGTYSFHDPLSGAKGEIIVE